LLSMNAEGVLLWDAMQQQVVARFPLAKALLGGFTPRSDSIIVGQGQALYSVPLAVGTNVGFDPPVLIARPQSLGHIAVARDGAVAYADVGRKSVICLSGTNEVVFPVNAYPGRPVFSPDGRWLACPPLESVDSLVYDRQNPTAAPFRLPEPKTTPTFTPDGKWLLSFDTQAALRRVGTWEAGPALPLDRQSADWMTAALSADGHWLVVTQHKQEVHLIDLSTRQTAAVLNSPGEGRIFGMAFSPDGQTLVIARQLGQLQFWKLPKLRAALAKLGLDW